MNQVDNLSEGVNLLEEFRFVHRCQLTDRRQSRRMRFYLRGDKGHCLQNSTLQ